MNTRPTGLREIPGFIARTSPSLALIKYWGKSDTSANLPATPSLAISLKHLVTETRLWAIDSHSVTAGGSGPNDMVVVGGKLQPSERFTTFFDGFRSSIGRPGLRFWAESRNSFPTAAGLASSSSGFAALTLAAAAATDLLGQSASPGGSPLPGPVLEKLSALARQGSGSAARALYGGFTLLPSNSASAHPLFNADHWPELRVIVVRISEAAKDLSSRVAMERTRQTSPYYPAWVADAPGICEQARLALAARDLDRLGPLIQASYLRMFATMFAALPPVIYWQAQSLAVIKFCQRLRDQGLAAWETMDAGPQVKIFCLSHQVDEITRRMGADLPELEYLVDETGDGPSFPPSPVLLGEVAPELVAAATACGVRLGTETGRALRPNSTGTSHSHDGI